MAGKDVIAVVSTPLHLIYLAELVYEHDISSVEVIVMLKRETDRPHLEQVLKELDYDCVHWLVLTSSHENRFVAIFEVLRSRGLPLNRESYQYGVFADYGRGILANVECENYYWIGDGTKLIYETSDSGRGSLNRHKLHALASPLVKLLTGRRLLLPRQEVVFTPLPIQMEGAEKNPFAWLRGKYDFEPSRQDRSSVYFFGSYFSERTGQPLMEDRVYLNYLRAIAAYYRDRDLEVVYVPHRHESEEKVVAINRIDNFRVDYFEYPAELEFYIRGMYPIHVASFFSTCLFHFQSLGVSESVTGFYVDFSPYNPSYAAVAEEIYSSLRLVLGEDSFVNLDANSGVAT